MKLNFTIRFQKRTRLKNNSKIFLLFLCQFILLIVKTGYSQGTADDKFASFLFSKGEYYRAITEYYRVYYISSDRDVKVNCLKNIGLCYFSGEDYDGFINFFRRNRNDFILTPKTAVEMKILEGKSYFKLNSYERAISIFEKTQIEYGDSLYPEKYFFTALSYAHLYNWRAANENLELVNKGKKFSKIQEYLNKQHDGLPVISSRNPTLAGILSGLVPGTGYIYSGRISTGISSLLVNGLLIWAIIDATKNHQYGLSLSLGFFGMGWYVGNIIGSVNAANQYNTYNQEQYLKNHFPSSYK